MKNVTYTSASAGTGKTYYLTETLAELIAGGKCVPEQVIMTTFSEASAQDLKARAKEKLYKKSVELGNAKLADMAERLDEAVITTIHGMCRHLICKYWYLLDLSPDMEVIVPDDQQFYFSQTIAEAVSDEDIRFFDEFEKDFAISAEGGWRKLALDVIEKMASYNVERLDESVAYSLDHARRLRNPGISVGLPLRAEVDGVIDKLSAFDFGKAQVDFDKLKKETKITYPFVLDLIGWCTKNKKTKEATKDFIDRYSAIYESEVVCTLQCEYIKKVFDIADKCFDMYCEYKRKHNLIDYSDMERYAHDVLTKKEYAAVRNELAGAYKYIFVDEFQDCSPLQVKIFDELSHLVEGGSYWVGDTKQIVYSWRGAHPLLIDAVIDKIKYEDNCKIGEDLNISRRSAPAIVGTVRDTFKGIYPDVKDFVHWDKRAQECKGIKNPVRLWPITSASTIEKYVYALIHNEGVTPDNIAILGRANDGLKKIADALESVGIRVDCSAADDKNGADNPVVALVMAILNVVASKYNHLAKAEIAYLLSQDHGIGEIIDAKLLWNEADKDVRGEFLSEIGIIKKIIDNRDRWIPLPICDLVETVIVELNLHTVAMAIKGSRNIDAVIQMVVDAAHGYEERCRKMYLAATLSGFVAHLSGINLPKTGGKDSVHLCTYHKSKGREWKYVILTDLQSDANRTNEWYIKNYSGVHVDHPATPTSENLYTDTVIRLQPWLWESKKSLPDALKAKVDASLIDSIKKANIQEAARLMYVGMTRARDVLIFATSVKSIEPLDGVTKKWFDVISAPFPMNACAVCDCADVDMEQAGITTTVMGVDISTGNEVANKECRDLNPSECHKKGKADRMAYWQTRLPLKKADGQDVTDADIGDAIHEIYYGIERNRDLQHIKDILDAYGIKSDDEVANGIVANWDCLTSYLSTTYGQGKTYHELPFKYKVDGQIYTGSIDLIWETSDEAVIVDYKSCQLGISHIENQDDAHYAGHYKGQLDCYTTALEKAGRKVIDPLIFYPSLGLVVRVE